jgi:hypothetical protein
MFLRDFGVRDQASQVRSRDIASSVFLLLHSLSHHVMHGISRFSGLDLGSMSEAIFPADLAFSGSSAWHDRGFGQHFIDVGAITMRRFWIIWCRAANLRCGSGTLCDHPRRSMPSVHHGSGNLVYRGQPVTFAGVTGRWGERRYGMVMLLRFMAISRSCKRWAGRPSVCRLAAFSCRAPPAHHRLKRTLGRDRPRIDR